MTSNELGYGVRSIVLDIELLHCPELTLTEKVVLAYIDQVLPFEEYGDRCAEYLDLSTNEVNRARKHLLEMGLIEEEL